MSGEDRTMLTVVNIPWDGTEAEAAEPESAPVAPLSAMLDETMRLVRRFVVTTADQASAIALWVALTYVFEAFECAPYLSISSATKRSGKTRLLELLETVVHRPWLTGRTSAAALVRKVDADQPTLLLDESDAAFRGNPVRRGAAWCPQQRV